MPYPAWQPGELPWDLSSFPSPSWAHLLPPFPALERPLHLALPCIGLDGVSHGLAALSVPFQVVYAFDTLGCLRQPLATIHGAHAETFNLGPREGDIWLADVGSWDRVDAVVCGPPCQPDSNIGLRLHAADPRAAVLNKVTEIITDQGRKGAFFFIAELVPGAFANHKKKSLDQSAEVVSSGIEECAYAAWLRDLRPRAPMFNLVVWKLNAATYLPQNRVRHFVVGTNRVFLPQAPIAPPSPSAPPLRLEDVLVTGPELPRDQEAGLSPAKLSDLRVLIESSKARVGWTSQGPPFWLTLPLDRDMEKQWAMRCRVDGLIETLRTGDEFKWIVQVGREPRFSRCLHPVERLTLQGCPTSLAKHCSKRELLLRTGNAFSVPVTAAVMQQLCQALWEHGFLRGHQLPQQLEDLQAARRDLRRARAQELRLETLSEHIRAQALRRRLEV